MGKFSDKFLNAFTIKDDEYDDEYYDDDEFYDDEEDDFLPDEEFKKVPVKKKEKPEEERVAPAYKPQTPHPAPASRVNSIRTGRGGQQEVCIFKPSSIEDSREITETLLLGKAVVINFEGLHVEISQRIIDFISGSCYALDGNLQKISNYIFIATPNSVDISGDFQDIFNAESNSFDIAGFKSPLL